MNAIIKPGQLIYLRSKSRIMFDANAPSGGWLMYVNDGFPCWNWQPLPMEAMFLYIGEHLIEESGAFLAVILYKENLVYISQDEYEIEAI